MERRRIMERRLKIKDEYLRLIIDIGYDYDGYENNIAGLRYLIQEMCRYAKAALNEDDKTPILIGSKNGKAVNLNILGEEITNEEKG